MAEVASVTDIASIPAKYRARNLLRACEALVRRLFESVEALVGRRTGSDTSLHPQQVMVQLIERQEALRKAVDESKFSVNAKRTVIEHQKLNAAIEDIRKAVVREDAKLAHIAASLREAETGLQDAIDEATPKVAALSMSRKRPVDVDEVVSYGSKISASLAAPHGWDHTQPLGHHLPPAPPEDLMRSGRLFALALESAGGESAT